MLRYCYQCLLHLHPERFRERYAEEMMSIFDHVGGKAERAKLVADAFVSLLRQWIFRPQNWEQKMVASVPAGTTTAPTFFVLGDFKPRKSTLFYGALLTLLLCSSLLLALKYSRKHYVYLPRALPEMVVDPDALDSYTGMYSSDLPSRLTVSITQENGQLLIETPTESKVALNRVQGGRFAFSDAPTGWIEFSRHANGVVYEIHVYRNGSEFRARRVVK